MFGLYLLAACAILGMFILFLVLGRTLNNIINHLTKLEYLLQKELDLQQEVLTIQKMLDEEDASEKGK